MTTLLFLKLIQEVMFIRVGDKVRLVSTFFKRFLKNEYYLLGRQKNIYHKTL